MSNDRFRARLANLDHETLLSYAAELSVAHRHEADALLVKHSPLPAWAHDDVLLSVDLLPHVFATLQMKDNAAASVCQAWKAAWVATNDGRRGLRRGLDFPVRDVFRLGDGAVSAVKLPDGNLLVSKADKPNSIIVDPSSMKTIREDVQGCFRYATANEFGLFRTFNEGRLLQRYDLDTFTMTHEYSGHRHADFDCPTTTSAPGGLLFTFGRRFDTDGFFVSSEIVCFDARTLEARNWFGSFNHSHDMVAVGNELFVLFHCSKTIKVFSLAGSFLRSFGIDCRAVIPLFKNHLQHFDGRLYFFSKNMKSIVVCTLEGKRLQVWRPDAGRKVTKFFIYDRKLLITTENKEGRPAARRLEALQGI